MFSFLQKMSSYVVCLIIYDYLSEFIKSLWRQGLRLQHFSQRVLSEFEFPSSFCGLPRPLPQRRWGLTVGFCHGFNSPWTKLRCRLLSDHPVERGFLFARRLVTDDELLLFIDHEGIGRHAVHEEHITANG